MIVVSFMAILELGKLNIIHALQHQLFGPIWVYCEKRNAQRLAEMKPLDMAYGEISPFKSGLVKLIQKEILRKKEENSLENILEELEHSHSA